MILLTGKDGQLGWELRRTLAPLGPLVAVDVGEMPLDDTAAIRRVVREVQPALIVNAAAYTAVDRAEDEPELAMAVNGVAPAVLADEARRIEEQCRWFVRLQQIQQFAKIIDLEDGKLPDPLQGQVPFSHKTFALKSGQPGGLQLTQPLKHLQRI